MSPVTSDRQKAVRFALAYPFEKPQGSFVWADGRVLPLDTLDLGNLGDTRIRSAAGDGVLGDLLTALYPDERAGREEWLEERVIVLAHGSNSAPERLLQKFPGGDGLPEIVPVLKARIDDWAVVYAAALSGYASIPATLEPIDGASAEVHVTLLTRRQLEIMNATEDLGVEYNLHRIDSSLLYLQDLHASSGLEVDAYISCHGAMRVEESPVALAAVPQSGHGFRALTQPDMQKRLHDMAAPELPFEDFVAGNIKGETGRARTLEAIARHCRRA
ncbi:hypothetical protein FHS78_000802 [Parvibaculum indicum]|uniref:hypothetical protein n=1 Tax=Parvibaculum indicum TaxID=562969 RepID=UPI00141FC46B|nr:hypothetical protein [Parvibaculum indicum]NIJ40532.1 hypothetical protein [Parvibaculum indicum]